MKSLISISVFFILANLNAQRIKPFLGAAILFNSEYERSSILNLNGGIEFKVNHYFKPEIEAGFYFGAIKETTEGNDQGFTTTIYERGITALTLSFLPKIIFNSHKTEEEGIGYFQIFPAYTISRVAARGNYIVVNQNNFAQSTEEKETISVIHHSFGIGLGFYINLSENNLNALAVNVVYQPIDFGKSIAQLKYYKNTQFNTKDQVGLGVKFYFGRKHKEK